MESITVIDPRSGAFSCSVLSGRDLFSDFTFSFPFAVPLPVVLQSGP